MSRFIKIGEAAKFLGVSIQTLRRWEENGYLLPIKKTKGSTRYYDLEQLNGKQKEEKKLLTVAYARVSSHDQKQDLQRQAQVLTNYCTEKGWNFQVIQDLGSGMTYHKKGLKLLIDLIFERKIDRFVLTHKDRLLRFGSELIFTLCEKQQIEVILINKERDVSFEEELAQDVFEIVTVFSARLYGSRSKKNKKLIEAARVFNWRRKKMNWFLPIRLD